MSFTSDAGYTVKMMSAQCVALSTLAGPSDARGDAVHDELPMAVAADTVDTGDGGDCGPSLSCVCDAERSGVGQQSKSQVVVVAAGVVCRPCQRQSAIERSVEAIEERVEDGVVRDKHIDEPLPTHFVKATTIGGNCTTSGCAPL